MAFFSHLPHWKSRNKCSDFTRVRPGENLGILLDVHPRNHKRLTTNIDSNNHSVIDIYGIHLSYIWVNHCRELPFAPTHPIIPMATIQEMLKAGVAGSIRINIEGLSENWQNSRLPSIAADHHVLHMYCRKKKKTIGYTSPQESPWSVIHPDFPYVYLANPIWEPSPRPRSCEITSCQSMPEHRSEKMRAFGHLAIWVFFLKIGVGYPPKKSRFILLCPNKIDVFLS